MGPDHPPNYNHLALTRREWNEPAVWRTYKTVRGVAGSLFFGKFATERFDDPARDFGVCYLGVDTYTAFIECFRQRARFKCVAESEIQQSSVVRVQISPLNLLDITGPGLAHLGQTGNLTSSESHVESQIFSRRIFEHPENVDGILYRAKQDPNRFSIALFERAEHKVTADTSAEWHGHGQLVEILDHYELGLI